MAALLQWSCQIDGFLQPQSFHCRSVSMCVCQRQERQPLCVILCPILSLVQNCNNDTYGPILFEVPSPRQTQHPYKSTWAQDIDQPPPLPSSTHPETCMASHHIWYHTFFFNSTPTHGPSGNPIRRHFYHRGGFQMGVVGKARVRVVICRLAADRLTTSSCTEEMCISGLPHPHSRARARPASTM